MVLGKEQARVRVEVAVAQAGQLATKQILLEQLLPEPERDGHRERPEPAGGEREIGLQEPLELEKRLVVERDIVDLLECDASLAQTVRGGAPGKAGVVPFPAEALLLRRGDDATIRDQRGGGVVVER